ncbi:MAG: hypothetical protein H7125_04290 [Proteobacteria bacterium]|nr:hypothetical protein [Burkholderiales bacterium]
MPPANTNETFLTEQYFQAVENMIKVFAIRPDDKLLFLSDFLIDPRVFHAIAGIARSRGVKPELYMSSNWNNGVFPDELKAVYEKASLVVSTWFASIGDPYCLKVRKDTGQRTVKMTYFRSIDVLKTPQARFPAEIVGEITRATRDMYPANERFALRITDPRGTEWTANFTPEMRDNMLSSNRWRGQTTADEPGAYVHWVPTHGPNIYDRTTLGKKMDRGETRQDVNGIVYPQGAVGFPQPFSERVGVVFENDRITEVRGASEDAAVLRDMLVGGVLVELGCGFNPKAPRGGIYPAGSNSPGALHFGIELAKPCAYIQKAMPNWEEPPIHMDLVLLDATVVAGRNVLVQDGFLTSLRNDRVIEAARRYGDPVDLLEGWPA